ETRVSSSNTARTSRSTIATGGITASNRNPPRSAPTTLGNPSARSGRNAFKRDRATTSVPPRSSTAATGDRRPSTHPATSTPRPSTVTPTCGKSTYPPHTAPESRSAREISTTSTNANVELQTQDSGVHAYGGQIRVGGSIFWTPLGHRAHPTG